MRTNEEAVNGMGTFGGNCEDPIKANLEREADRERGGGRVTMEEQRDSR